MCLAHSAYVFLLILRVMLLLNYSSRHTLSLLSRYFDSGLLSMYRLIALVYPLLVLIFLLLLHMLYRVLRQIEVVHGLLYSVDNLLL